MEIKNIQRKSYNFSPNENTKKTSSIWKNLIILSIPVAVYLLFQHLGQAIDYFIIGEPVKNHDIDGVLTYLKQVKKVFQSIAVSLSGAGIILVTREYKNKNIEKAKNYTALAFLFTIIISSSIFIIYFLGNLITLPGFFSGFILNKEYKENPDALLCYNISLLTSLFIAINSVFIGLERAKDRKKFVLFVNILNITVRIILSFLYKGIRGTNNVSLTDLAFADFYSTLLISFLAFFFIFRSKNDFRIQFTKINIDKFFLKSFFKLSSVLIIGKATYEIGKQLINDKVITYYDFDRGNEILGIAGLVAVVNGIFYAIALSFEDSQTVMVSQNLSIKKNNLKTVKIFKIAIIITFIIGIMGILSNYFFGERILKFLKPDKTFADETMKGFKEILFWEQMSLFTSVFSVLIMGYIVACKKSANIVVILNMLRIILRISCLSILFNHFDSALTPYQQFGLSTGISNIIVLFVSIGIFIIFLNKNKEKN
ncbi:MATE family efflux transporter [Candidatus Phytoplasma pini]|uniref:Na+-driven multidrug efflux pump n=1 Tax=Candidatus Phytoplasma pini TaxID=267362 RepID=A0A559KJ83_9MOLU|nr:MATE family efflux transporter [Candidatus Phytoplasma pini]TVY12186.1 Na+-driven multidrug efflux pump [Candidatus Phytoplasma pini]